MEIVRSFLKLPMACKWQAGFTLNEILVAMNVIVIAVLGYSLNTLGVIQGNMANDNMTIAINLAQDKMEQLKAQKNMINDDRCPGSGDHALTATGAPNGIFKHTPEKERWRKEVRTSSISGGYRCSHAFLFCPESSRLSLV
jgi:prepilin-type N-terminal cleavage/methylation domain-containing protein